MEAVTKGPARHRPPQCRTKSGPSRVLVSLPFSLMWRNFICSGLVADLQAELNIRAGVISPYQAQSFGYCSNGLLPNYSVPAIKGDSGLPRLLEVTPLDRLLHSIHLTGFAQEFPNGSLQNMELSRRRSLQALAAFLLRSFAPRNSARRHFLRRAYSLYRPRRKSVFGAFEECRPRWVLVASPGHYWLDYYVLAEARRRRIPSVCVVLSWDNLYSRGPMAKRPDYLFVWSEEMRRQATDVHEFPENRIFSVGALQFVHYDKPVSAQETARMRQSVGLTEDEPFVAYVCGARTSLYDVEDVLAMQATLREGVFHHLRIVVRPHPQGNKGIYAELLKHGILLDQTLDLTEENQLDSFDVKAIRHMAAFLSSANFVVSSWGTTALLEACIFQRPAVQLRWMDSVRHADAAQVQKVRDFQSYLHMRAFDESQARPYSDSPSDLNTILQTLLVRSELFEQRRSDALKRLTCLPLGGVTKRAVDALRSLPTLGVTSTGLE